MKARERYRRSREATGTNLVWAVTLTLVAGIIIVAIMIFATTRSARAQDANANCRATADSVVFATGNRQLANRIYMGCRISMPLPIALPKRRTTGRGGRDVPPMIRALPPLSSNALDDIGNPARGITRAEVEFALIDWCSTHADAALCRKLQR